MSDNARILELCEQNGFLEQTVEDLKNDIEALETKVKLWRAEAMAAREIFSRVSLQINDNWPYLPQQKEIIAIYRAARAATDEALK